MKILITGIHGFVGANLVTALKQGRNIYGLDIITSEKEGIIKTFSWYDLDRIPVVDCIIHLAGKAHDTKNTSSEKEYFDVNYGLTKKIFDLFLKSKAKKFIYFSSVKAAADTVDGILTEEVKPNPKTAYGKSKLAAEQYILSQELPKNKIVYILRPCMIHGPGNKGNLNLLYKVVKKGFPWPLGAFENERSFTSIDNLNFIIKNLIEKDIPSGVYNVADDELVSTVEIIILMAQVLNINPRIFKVSPKGINFLAKINTLFRLPFDEEKLQKLTENYVVSNRKIINAMGQSLPVKSVDGLVRTIESFKINKKP